MTEDMLNAKESIKLLQAEGFKVSKSTFYEDRKRSGLIKSDGGKFSKENLLKYAKKKPLPYTDQRPPKSATEHIELKNRLLRARAEEAELRNQITAGKYVEREEVALEQAIKAAAFKSGLVNLARIVMPELVRIVGGRHSKVQDAALYWADRIEDLLHEFSKLDVLKVVIEQPKNESPSYE